MSDAAMVRLAEAMERLASVAERFAARHAPQVPDNESFMVLHPQQVFGTKHPLSKPVDDPA